MMMSVVILNSNSIRKVDFLSLDLESELPPWNTNDKFMCLFFFIFLYIDIPILDISLAGASYCILLGALSVVVLFFWRRGLYSIAPNRG